VAEHAGAPRRPALDELGPRQREEDHRMVPDVGDEVVDQVEQRVVPPMQVLEDEEERLANGQVLDQPARPEQQVDLIVRRRVQAESQDHG
jgi:hypothetical protein